MAPAAVAVYAAAALPAGDHQHAGTRGELVDLGVKRRVAYHLIETRRIPHFKVGKTVCAKRSKVTAALEQFEEGE